MLKKDVLDPSLPSADIITAGNFCYFLFTSRRQLLDYFSKALNSLNPRGIFIIDVFGGSLRHAPNEEKTTFDGFSYYFEQATFDPVTHKTRMHIHFKQKGEKKRRKVFTYDWRLWSLPELRDVMIDAGADDVRVYWEGKTEKAEGNGEYKWAQHGDAYDSWVAYLVATGPSASEAGR